MCSSEIQPIKGFLYRQWKKIEFCIKSVSVVSWWNRKWQFIKAVLIMNVLFYVFYAFYSANHAIHESTGFMDSLERTSTTRTYGQFKKKKKAAAATIAGGQKSPTTPPSPVSPTSAVARSLPSVPSVCISDLLQTFFMLKKFSCCLKEIILPVSKCVYVRVQLGTYTK